MKNNKLYLILGFIIIFFISFYLIKKKNNKEKFTNLISNKQANIIRSQKEIYNRYIEKISKPLEKGWRNEVKNGDISSISSQDYSSLHSKQRAEIYKNETQYNNTSYSGRGNNTYNTPNTDINQGFSSGSSFKYNGKSYRSGLSLPPKNQNPGGGVIIDGRRVFIEKITFTSNTTKSSDYIMDTYGNSSVTIKIQGYVDPTWNQPRNSNTFSLGIALLDLTTGEYLKKQEPSKNKKGVQYVDFMDTIFSEITYNHQTYANSSNCKKPSDCNDVAGGVQNVQKGVAGKWTCSLNRTEDVWKSQGNRYCAGYSHYNRFPTSDLETCKAYCDKDSRCNAIAVGPDCVTYRGCSIVDRRQNWGWNFWSKETKDLGENKSKEIGKCAVQCNTDSDCNENVSGLSSNGNWKCINKTCQASCSDSNDCERAGMKNHECKTHVHFNSNEALTGYLQRGYRGSQNKTPSGRTCQNWRCFEDGSCKHTGGSLNTIIRNKNNKSWNEAAGMGNHNFCRNPDYSSDGIWCYTTDPNKRWEYCKPLEGTKEKKCEPKSGEKTWVNTFGGANWRDLKQPRYSFNYESKPIIIDNSVDTRIFFLVFKGRNYNPNNFNLRDLNFKSDSYGTGAMLVVQPRYEYKTSSWSKCSQECGLTPGGTSERKISCYDKATGKEPEKKGACNGLKMPSFSKKCNRKICENSPEIKNFNVMIGKADTKNLNNNDYNSIQDNLVGINNKYNVPTESYQPSLLYVGKKSQNINTSWRIVTKNNSLKEVFIYSPSFDGFLGLDTDPNIATKDFLKISKAKYKDKSKNIIYNDKRDLWSISFYNKKMFPVYIIRHINTGKYLTWFGKQMKNINLGVGENRMGRLDLSTTPKPWVILPMQPDYNRERSYHDAIKFCLLKNKRLCTAKKLDIYKRLTGSLKSSWVPHVRINKISQSIAINTCFVEVWLYWIIGIILNAATWMFGGSGGNWFLNKASNLEKSCNSDTKESHFKQAATTDDEWFHLENYDKHGVRFSKKNSGFYCCPEPIANKCNNIDGRYGYGDYRRYSGGWALSNSIGDPVECEKLCNSQIECKQDGKNCKSHAYPSDNRCYCSVCEPN